MSTLAHKERVASSWCSQKGYFPADHEWREVAAIFRPCITCIWQNVINRIRQSITCHAPKAHHMNGSVRHICLYIQYSHNTVSDCEQSSRYLCMHTVWNMASNYLPVEYVNLPVTRFYTGLNPVCWHWTWRVASFHHHLLCMTACMYWDACIHVQPACVVATVLATIWA